MRKFSSTDESLNHSSPTSSYNHYPIYSQIEKNGKTHLINTIIDLNYNLPISEYSLEDYYSSNRINSATSTVNYNNNVIAHKSNLNLVVSSNNPEVVPVVRVVKRRTTANKKERRRTMSINGAYTSLRDHIPNVPSDTKLSKVSLIFYLSITLSNNYYIFK